MALSTVPFQQRSAMISPHAASAAYPDWALLNKTARFSDERNETTAECGAPWGWPVAVSFWLADPPAVSRFTVHCPGLPPSRIPPYVICAEGAFVLFSVTLVDWSLRYFVYSAAGAGGNPSLQLLPSPSPYVPTPEELGLLPCGDEHYAVVFLNRVWPLSDSHGKTAPEYHVCVFSSETNAWRRSQAAPPQLSDSDQALFGTYGRGGCKQIAVGESAVGWVDLMSGILLACNLFDETPAMRFIPFPSSRARITYYEYGAPECFCGVACSSDLIRFVDTDLGEPGRRANGQGLRATTWNMKLDWDDWRKRCTVDVGDVSVDRSYSALLPELLDQRTGQLELKKLHFLIPILSVRNDNLLYMVAKVDQRDSRGWVVVVDMKCAVLEALVPVSTEPYNTITLPYCSCVFPRFYRAADTIETDDGSQDSDSMQEDGYCWRRNWCEESLASWNFSEEEDGYEEEENDDDEDLIRKQEEEKEDDNDDDNNDNDDDDSAIREEEEKFQAMKTLFCHETNGGADMGNPVDNQDESYEIWLAGFNLDVSEHQEKKKTRRRGRKRTRSSRRRKAPAQAQVLDCETVLLDLLRFVCCILMAIIVWASIMANPG